MKRLNPTTNNPFKEGDIRDDGFIFQAYIKTNTKKDGYFVERWLSPLKFQKYLMLVKLRNDKKMSSKEGHIKRIWSTIKSRSKIKNVPFNISLEYLVSIAPDNCPVFNVPLTWAQVGSSTPFSPSVDKIIPPLGYIEGNVQWLSLRANAMKQDATPEELKQFSDWIIHCGSF